MSETRLKIGYPEKDPGRPADGVPKCWVTQTLVRIRYAHYGMYQPPFEVAAPAYWGHLPECRAWAKEMSNELNLPVIEIGRENPNLQSRDFEAPGIYIIIEKFGQFNDPGHRVYRY